MGRMLVYASEQHLTGAGSKTGTQPDALRVVLPILLGPAQDEAAHSVGFPLAPDAVTGGSLRGDLRPDG